MPVLNIILILLLLIPAGVLMIRTAADIRRDVILHKKKVRAAAPVGRDRFRVVK